MRVAVIKNRNIDNDNVEYFVDNVFEFASIIGMEEMKETLECDYIIPVSDVVGPGHIFNAKLNIFLNDDGERIYPPITLEERLDMIEDRLNNTDDIKKEDYEDSINKVDYTKQFIKKICEDIIINGFEFCTFTEDNPLHYSLSVIKQKDLDELYQAILNNPDIKIVMWRDDNIKIKKSYPVDKFIDLYEYLMVSIQCCKITSDLLESTFIDKMDDYSLIRDILMNSLIYIFNNGNISNALSQLDVMYKTAGCSLPILVDQINTYINLKKFRCSKLDINDNYFINIYNTIFTKYIEYINNITI